ncbi:unnamed protein product [Wuchereria bancrofti]|uniref:Uncharacterized protein n=1 Tax=Wuchereria bancrofti TaxID=6293 RepID=A0A3P7EGW4_WUCBA|nr:unnamed protein product [Wuchereria bancrofti]
MVASVGSYMMYRVCARFLGENFVWTILEQARFDLLTRNETYLLKPRMGHLRRTRQLCIGSVKSSRKQSEIISEDWKYSASMASQSSSNAEFTSSEKSASLHLLWDDPQWDETTDFCFYGIHLLHFHWL